MVTTSTSAFVVATFSSINTKTEYKKLRKYNHQTLAVALSFLNC